MSNLEFIIGKSTNEELVSLLKKEVENYVMLKMSYKEKEIDKKEFISTKKDINNMMKCILRELWERKAAKKISKDISSDDLKDLDEKRRK